MRLRLLKSCLCRRPKGNLKLIADNGNVILDSVGEDANNGPQTAVTTMLKIGNEYFVDFFTVTCIAPDKIDDVKLDAIAE
jgi:hypothetical protein